MKGSFRKYDESAVAGSYAKEDIPSRALAPGAATQEDVAVSEVKVGRGSRKDPAVVDLQDPGLDAQRPENEVGVAERDCKVFPTRLTIQLHF